MTGLLEGIGSIAGIGSAIKDVHDVLKGRVDLEESLADLIEEKFVQHLPRLQHLCPSGVPEFFKSEFAQKLRKQTFALTKPEELETAVLPHLIATISTPGANCPEGDFLPTYESIVTSASRHCGTRSVAFQLSRPKFNCRNPKPSLKVKKRLTTSWRESPLS
jgi:hypothetical protein